MKGGKLLNNWRMAQIHAQESPERARELEQWGAVFDRTPDGEINQRPFGGHSFARLVHVGDRTGLELIRTLQDHSIHQGIDVFMEYTVTDLFTTEGNISGALCYNRHNGESIVFHTKGHYHGNGWLLSCILCANQFMGRDW